MVAFNRAWAGLAGIALVANAPAQQSWEITPLPARDAAIMWRLDNVPPSSRPIIRDAGNCEKLTAMALPDYASVTESRVVSGIGGAAHWCRVTITVTRTTARSPVTIWLGLPLSHWNGRFLGLGGGGFMGGTPSAVAEGVAKGFAAGATDASNAFDPSSDLKQLIGVTSSYQFLADSQGRLDWLALRNWSYLSAHDMTVIGKSVTASFYGTKPHHSYFSGCSTGGRQGLTAAQRFPEDYDGIIAGAPAINFTRLIPMSVWTSAITNENRPIAQCKADAARKAAKEFCDAEDGLRDGVSSNVVCKFDTRRLIGTQTDCGMFDANDAEVMRRIWDGPRRSDGSFLWHGRDPRAAIAVEGPNPSPSQKPGFISILAPNWQEPALSSMRTAEFEQFFDQFGEQFGAVLATSNPDLTKFSARGAKVIIWHGTEDNYIPFSGTLDYVDNVRRVMGARQTDAFLRFYPAPGVEHCGGGGPEPLGLLNALVGWVETGKAPATLLSERRDAKDEVIRQRPLCPYPLRQTYRGRGSNDAATSFTCGRGS